MNCQLLLEPIVRAGDPDYAEHGQIIKAFRRAWCSYCATTRHSQEWKTWTLILIQTSFHKQLLQRCKDHTYIRA